MGDQEGDDTSRTGSKVPETSDRESVTKKSSIDSRGTAELGSEKLKKKKSKDSVTSTGSTDSKKSTKSKGKGKGIAEQRGSLKFGDDEEPKKGQKEGREGSQGKKKKDQSEEKKKPDKGEFDISKYKKHTVVLFHDNNDLMWAKGVGFKPSDAVPKKGPGVTEEIETMFGPCALLTEFKYTTWADTVVPLRNHNIVQGFNEMALCLIELAATGGENMSHEDAFLAVSFLSNVRNDLGEYPPNILALMEHIDFLTRNDGTAGSGNPKFKHMENCELKEWY